MSFSILFINFCIFSSACFKILYVVVSIHIYIKKQVNMNRNTKTKINKGLNCNVLQQQAKIDIKIVQGISHRKNDFQKVNL